MYKAAERLDRGKKTAPSAERAWRTLYPCSVVTADTLFGDNLQRVNPLFRLAADRTREFERGDNAA